MSGIFVFAAVVLVAVVVRLACRKRHPLLSIEKMAMASAAYMAAFWGYLYVRGDGPISESLIGLLVSTPIIWIVSWSFRDSRGE
jgi:uncharacterized membrane protein